jgi:1,4-dihydroxy-2-naphthoyl-CoA hydrolase
MNVEKLIERIENTDGLSKTLGMHFISTPEPDTLQATMKVNEKNKQPFGFLSGGASLALAENLAGVGSLAICPGQMAVGINVSGTHMLAVTEGDTVTAYGKLIHKGRTLHTWRVDLQNGAGDLICTVQVTNYVFTPKTKQ